MKRINQIILMVLVISFASCNKNEDLINKTMENSSESIINGKEMILDNVPFIVNPYPVEKYLEVYEDLDDKRINKSLYEISLISREILKTKEWNELIISKAKENLSATMGINELVEKTDLKSNNIHFKELKDKLQNLDLTHVSRNPKKSGIIENYVATYYVPNIGIADFTKQPIICPGIEVNSELPGAEDLEDYIVGWAFIDGEWKEFVFNEETAMKTTNPIFIVDNASENLMNVSSSKDIKLLESSHLKSANEEIQMGVSTHEYRLDYRFEGSGKSDFYIKCLHVDEYGTYHGPIDNMTYSMEQEIAQVDKDDIGKDLQKWFDIAHGTYDPISLEALVWNTFERDWYRSKKSLGTPTWQGETFYLYGNMHYKSDWYGCKPERINEYIVNLGDLHSNWLFDAVSDHGHLGIWRTAY